MTEHLEALRKGEAWNFRYEKDPRCPHCGTVQPIADHEWYHLYNEGEHEVECHTCDREFLVSTSVEYRFCTDEQEED